MVDPKEKFEEGELLSLLWIQVQHLGVDFAFDKPVVRLHWEDLHLGDELKEVLITLDGYTNSRSLDLQKLWKSPAKASATAAETENIRAK
jgi:hypothetical protein